MASRGTPRRTARAATRVIRRRVRQIGLSRWPSWPLRLPPLARGVPALRVPSWVLRRRPGPTGPAPPDAATTPQGRRLVGVPTPLRRSVRVAAETVVVAVGCGDVELHPAGSLLRPGRPTLPRDVTLLVVNLAPVTLDLVLDDLPTLDERSLTELVVRVVVQVDPREDADALRRLAAQVGADLEADLLRRVHDELTTPVRAAVAMNTMADLSRLGVDRVLADRWLPERLAGGVLLRRDVSVPRIGWPRRTDAGPVP